MTRAIDLPRAARALEEFLTAIGAPVSTDPELKGTGVRAAEAYAHDLLSGYDLDPAALLAEGTISRAPGLVVVASIVTTTMCPHHVLPATGLAHVGYWPTDRVAGLGAIARVVDCFSRRFALQEDIGQNVADALVAHLGARGAGVVLDLDPTCMTARGDRRHGARAVTLAFAGEVDASMRSELASAVAMQRRSENA